MMDHLVVYATPDQPGFCLNADTICRQVQADRTWERFASDLHRSLTSEMSDWPSRKYGYAVALIWPSCPTAMRC